MNAPKDPALQLSRRAVVAGGLGAIAAPYVIRPALAKAGELRLLTWEGYAADPWVDAFERAHGVECKITYVGSADEMFAKSVGSKGQDYDVLSFDTSAFARYLDSGLLQPVAMDRIANAANLAPAFRDVAAVGATASLTACPSPGAPCRWSTARPSSPLRPRAGRSCRTRNTPSA